MKRYISVITALCLCVSVCALSACGRKEASAEPSRVGGWTVNSKYGNTVIPEGAMAAFDKAVEDYTGLSLTPVAYLGSQVVSGMNYAFLCTSSTVTAQPVTNLSTVTVYAALDGTAKITNVENVDIASYNSSDAGIEFSPAELVGGWNISEAAGSALPEDVQTAFDKALDGVLGVDYTPLAYLGSQVVAGQNHAVLCSAVSVTAEPSEALAVLIIYADLNGGAQLLRVSGFEF